MPTNQIVPFATGAGAEVVDPVTYAAEGYIQQGFQAGILQPYDLNTVLRQSSFVAAMIAQFTADHQSGNVNDDGNLAKLENQFLSALLSAVEGEGVAFCIDDGSTDALTATPSPALTAYKAGQAIAVFKNPNVGTNTTAAPTINLNGLGAVTIVKGSGVPLYAGDLPQGGLFMAVFDGTYFRHIGITLSTTDLRVQAGQAVAFVASGTNAYTGTLVPGPTALSPRMEVLGFFGSTNTSAAAPTLLLNGIGNPLPIVKQGGGTPSAGDVTGILPLVLNTAGTAWFINGPVPSDILALIAAQQIGLPQPPIIYATPGTFTYTPSAGTRGYQILVIGGCGGGGGTNAPGSGGVSMGVSGAAGATAIKNLTSLGSATATVVVGAAGAGGAAAASGGGNGGTSSFTCTNATVTCTGGAGGVNTGTVASFPQGTSTATGGSASGGDINATGGCSQAGLFLSSAQALVGPAGARLYGASPIQFGITQGGSPGTNQGSGGTGGLAYGGAAAQTGGAGAAGLVVVTEYH